MLKRKKEQALQGKVAIVTGSSRGLGSAIARLFYNEGARVVLTARNEELLNSLSKELGEALYYVCDLRDKDAVKGLVHYTVSRLDTVDILVNNAGVPCKKLFVDHSLDEIDDVVDVNLKGLLYTTHFAVPYMIKNESGVIVNISSTAGLRGSPERTVYCTSKFGVVGFSESLARELKEYNIKVHCLCPPAMDTEWHRHSENKTFKLWKTTEVAKKVLKLVVNEKKTGRCVTVGMGLRERIRWRRLHLQKV